MPKHHICNANLMKNGADFAVFLNTAQEFDGSDSGEWCKRGFLLVPAVHRAQLVGRASEALACCASMHSRSVALPACLLAARPGQRSQLARPRRIDCCRCRAGARPDEAVSWGKIRADAQPVKVGRARRAPATVGLVLGVDRDGCVQGMTGRVLRGRCEQPNLGSVLQSRFLWLN